MRRRFFGGMAALMVVLAFPAGAQAGGRLMVELGNAFTMGNFTYEDATIDIESSSSNPRGAIEWQPANSTISLGAEYLSSKNSYSGEYEDGDGTLDMERTEWGLYVRFGDRERTNFRIGYRNFKYDISNAIINDPPDRDVDGTATGDMTTGVDAELTLAGGDTIRFALSIGASYFLDADYQWSYLETAGDEPGPHSGTASLDAVGLRLKPEISFRASPNLVLFVNGTLAASTWIGDVDDDNPDYAGVDIFSGVGVGLRYYFTP